MRRRRRGRRRRRSRRTDSEWNESITIHALRTVCPSCLALEHQRWQLGHCPQVWRRRFLAPLPKDRSSESEGESSESSAEAVQRKEEAVGWGNARLCAHSTAPRRLSSFAAGAFGPSKGAYFLAPCERQVQHAGLQAAHVTRSWYPFRRNQTRCASAPATRAWVARVEACSDATSWRSWSTSHQI